MKQQIIVKMDSSLHNWNDNFFSLPLRRGIDLQLVLFMGIENI